MRGLVIFGIGFRVLSCGMGGVEDNGDVIESGERRAGLMWNFRKFIKE